VRLPGLTVNSGDDFSFYNLAKGVRNKAGMNLQLTWNLLRQHRH
jgi:hypothetical protein